MKIKNTVRGLGLGLALMLGYNPGYAEEILKNKYCKIEETILPNQYILNLKCNIKGETLEKQCKFLGPFNKEKARGYCLDLIEKYLNELLGGKRK